MQLEISLQMKKKFMKILPVGTDVFLADGRTDRHDEAYNRFSQFCEQALNLFMFLLKKECTHVENNTTMTPFLKEQIKINVNFSL